MTEMEYRDRVVAHMAATTTELAAIKKAIARIESGEACPIGSKLTAEVAHLKESDASQWLAIDCIRRPVRSAVLVSAGSGLTLGAVGRWFIFEFLGAFWGG